VVHPGVERIVICEIEPLIPSVVAEYFNEENHNVLRDPRVEIIYDDARHYILTTRERFDVITSDPIHPWVKGSATLYTAEYFEMVKQHLNPGGVVAQWVPTYESTADTVKSEFATFFSAFPEGVFWINEPEGTPPDVVLLGQAGPTRIDLDGLQRRMGRHDHAGVTESLAGVGFGSALELLATYGGRPADLAPWLEHADINRDRNLRLQYLAGMGLNSDESGQILAELLSYLSLPEDLFLGTPQAREALRKAFEGAARLSEDEKEAFELAVEEIKTFGEDETAAELAQEAEDIYKAGSTQDKKKWLGTYAYAEITKDEQAEFEDYLKTLDDDEERKAQRDAWDGTSLAGRRYYLRYVSGDTGAHVPENPPARPDP
jgi:spermidine synthase